jgi:tight adherence protein C
MITLVLGAVAVVGGIGAFWWGVTAKPSKAHANLFAGLSGPAASTPRSGGAMRTVGQGVRRVLPSSLVNGLENRLVQAGHPYDLDIARLLGIKVLVGLVMVVCGLLLGQPLVALVFGVLGFVLPDVWVTSLRDRRQADMRLAAADTIDQLTICVEAGLGFDAALVRVASTNEGPLAEELQRTVTDMRAGVPREQALRTLAERSQIPEIRQLVTALLQAQKHGVPLADTLRSQSADMRVKRKQMVEEKAAKLTVKMIFPIVVCFLPVFFIVVIVPAASKVFESL